MESLFILVPYILVGLIGLIVGALIGAFLNNLINRPEDPSKKPRQNLVEILRIWKDRRSGDYQVEIDGKIYTSPGKMDPRRRGDLTRSLNEVNHWIGISRPQQPTPAGTPSPSVSIPATPDGTDQAALTPKPAPPAITGSRPANLQSPGGAQTTLPPYENINEPARETRSSSILNPVNILERALRSKSDVETPEPKSIAVQINEILQEKLPSTPLKDRVIKILELPEKGLVVLVDQQQYQGVSEVTDPEIRAFLQECVADWERLIGS